MTQTTVPIPPPTQATVANTILRRHAERQRFDSADFAMALYQQKRTEMTVAAAAHAPPSLDTSDDFSDWVQCEFEPEPESPPVVVAPTKKTDVTVVPPQRIRRIRLQRFDSADWGLQCHQAKYQANTTAPAVEPTFTNTVAKLRLERHAYTTCSFVSTPIASQHFVKNA